MQDPAAWMDAINKTRRVFEMTSVRSINLPDTDPLYSEIANLVPWELTRVQIARTPAQRRLPRDILFTHRGAAIEYQDGQLAIEAESLDGMHFPKQRFSKGVSLAIFWFGYGEPKASPPPEEQPPKETPPQPQPDGSKPPAPAPSRPTETVTFKNCPADVPQEVCSAVKRLHLNLGHPTEQELLRLLAYQGAISKHMITAVKHLHCSSCSRNKPPLKPRPSAMPVANMGQFNDTIQSDVFYCRDVVGTNYAVLGIIDQSTLLHQACRLQDMSSNHTLEIFRNLWFKPYGFPGTIRTDPGTNYGLHFKQYVERHGIWLEIIPAEAHWRIGLIERRNSVLRDIFERIIDAESIFNVNDFDQALDSAVFALNSMTYTHGRPPYMAVFGQIPRIGAGLLQDDTALICHPDQQGMVRPDILRAEAIKALADINTSQALRRALLWKTATTHAMDLQPGQNCAYWRWQVPKGRSTKKKGAWIVARFLSYDPDGKSAWLHSRTTTVHVALEQLRGAVGFEQWQPTREDQQMLKQAANNIRQDLWQEHATTAPALEEDTYEYHMDDLENTDIAAAGAGTTEETTVALPLAPPPATATTTEETKTGDEQPTTVQVQQQHMEQHLQQQHSTTTNLRLGDVHFHSYPTSPAQRQVTPLDYHTQRFGLTRSARSRTPTNRRLTPRGDGNRTPGTPRASASTARQWPDTVPQTPPVGYTPPTAQTQAVDAPPAEVQTDTQQASQSANVAEPASGSNTTIYSSPPASSTGDHTAAASQQPQTEQPSNTTLPTLPQKRTHEAMLTLLYDSIAPPHYTWDGSPDTQHYAGEHCTQFAEAALGILQQEGHAVLLTDLTDPAEDTEAESSDPDQPVDPASRLNTRKEAKALEREIPWRQILKLPKEEIAAYVQSAKKEEKGWMDWGSVEAVDDDEAASILSNPVKRRRVLRSRACYRNKSRVPGSLIAKTRVVALGHLDPDLHRISRDSPTPMRVSEHILLCIFVAGINRSMEGDPVDWILWAEDVSTAFVQGTFEENERPEALYLLPPRDQITIMAQTFQAKLYRVLKNIYGLASAPRTWFKEVVRRMQSIDFVQHHLDRMLFYKRVNGRLMAACIVYVDDFLLTCRTDYRKEELLELFSWGSQKQLSIEQPLEFKGKELILKSSDKAFHLHVTQTKFIDNTDGGKLAKGRIGQGGTLTSAEQAEFRSVTGSLQWLASQTRPEIAAWVSLANKGGETSPADLSSLYETLEFCRETKHLGLTFQDVPINRSTVVLGYADASWANAQQCSSQQGCIIMLTSPHCTEANTKANVIDWRSNRSTRVCRSTLASEAMSCDDSVDRAYFASLVLSELLSGDIPTKDMKSWRLEQLQVTDGKSLFDAISAEHPKTTEKRTYIDIRSIQQFISPRTIRWCPTTVMWADGVTKAAKQLRQSLREWLNSPFSQLVKPSGKEKRTNESLKLHSPFSIQGS